MSDTSTARTRGACAPSRVPASLSTSAADSNGAIADENDLSSRASIFLDKIVHEFRLDGAASELDEARGPRFASSDLVSRRDVRTAVALERLLRLQPHQSVRFHIFKRSQEEIAAAKLTDKRLVRVTAGTRVPVGVWARWVTQHALFNGIIFGLIFATAVIQGVQLDLNVERAHRAVRAFDVFEDVTVVIFSLEIALKWADGFATFWLSGWNVFDFLVTLVSLLPRVITLAAGGGAAFGGIGSKLRLFRTLRALKAVARVRALRVVVDTVFEAFSDLGFILLLYLLLTYIFGIFALNVFSPYSHSPDPRLTYRSKFATLPSTFLTLFQMLTLDNWYALQADVRRVVAPYIVAAFFIFWIWLGAFIFRNIFVGVIVRKFDEMTRELRQAELERRRAHAREVQLTRLERELGRKDAVAAAAAAAKVAATSTRKVALKEPSLGDANRVSAHGRLAMLPGGAIADWAAPTNERQHSQAGGGPGYVAGEGDNGRVARSRSVHSGIPTEDLDTSDGMGHIGGRAAGAGDAGNTNRTEDRQTESNANGSVEGVAREDATDECLREFHEWRETVRGTLEGLRGCREEHVWPLLSVLRHLRALRDLQNNMREHRELQLLAAHALHEALGTHSATAATGDGNGGRCVVANLRGTAVRAEFTESARDE